MNLLIYEYNIYVLEVRKTDRRKSIRTSCCKLKFQMHDASYLICHTIIHVCIFDRVKCIHDSSCIQTRFYLLRHCGYGRKYRIFVKSSTLAISPLYRAFVINDRELPRWTKVKRKSERERRGGTESASACSVFECAGSPLLSCNYVTQRRYTTFYNNGTRVYFRAVINKLLGYARHYIRVHIGAVTLYYMPASTRTHMHIYLLCVRAYLYVCVSYINAICARARALQMTL